MKTEPDLAIVNLVLSTSFKRYIGSLHFWIALWAFGLIPISIKPTINPKGAADPKVK
ncbi:MAG: hypothetical protein QNK78_00600 [Crocinitomicaceae bacterium]|nr:hypothetical protein [Crocinitomicaceae bacterium]MDC0098747.1 hypothetical protein [Crocinitomicaceae bacterium]MDC1196201.1 hypothetical protein [Crocinitomicaceae bacterium]MDC1385171.1 hypothetical protein [Crocinitomicaceae bacterium]